jgi:hypothetical protein
MVRIEHRAGFADKGIELLRDQRVEARGGLVEHQQVRPVLQRDHQADLLLVALGVFLEPPVQVHLQPLRQRRLVGGVDSPA